MPAPPLRPPPKLHPATGARLRHKEAVRRLALRLDACARQILLDLANDKAVVSSGRLGVEIAADLLAALRVIQEFDDVAARVRRGEAA
jgi:hypothetical protein